MFRFTLGSHFFADFGHFFKKAEMVSNLYMLTVSSEINGQHWRRCFDSSDIASTWGVMGREIEPRWGLGWQLNFFGF
jgi:hypothetical protein